MYQFRRLLGFFSLSLVLLGLGPTARVLAIQSPASINLLLLPAIANCRSLHGWTSDWSPLFVASDYSVANSYQCEGYRLHVKVVQYVDQHQGKEAVGQFNSVIPRAWWNATTRTRQRVTADLDVDEYRVERVPLRLTIWYWYSVGVKPASSDFAVKAMEAFNALSLRARTTTNLTIALEAEPDFDARKVLKIETTNIWAWFNAEMRPMG